MTNIEKTSDDTGKKIDAGKVSNKELQDPKVQEKINNQKEKIIAAILRKLPNDQASKVQQLFQNPLNKEFIDKKIWEIAKLQIEAKENAKSLNKKDGISSRDVWDVDKVYTTHQWRYLNVVDSFNADWEGRKKTESIDLSQAPSLKKSEKNIDTNIDTFVTKNMEKNLKKINDIFKNDSKLQQILDKNPDWKQIIITQIGDMDIDDIKFSQDGSIKIIDKSDSVTMHNIGVGIKNTLRVFGHLLKSVGNKDLYNTAINKVSRSLTGHDALVVCPNLDILALEKPLSWKNKVVSISSKIFTREIPQTETEIKRISTVEFEWTPNRAFSKWWYEFTDEFTNSIKKDANILNTYAQKLKENNLIVPMFSVGVKAGIDSENYNYIRSPERTDSLLKEYEQLEISMKKNYPAEYENLNKIIEWKWWERNEYDKKLLFIRASKPFMELVKNLNKDMKVSPQFDVIVGSSKDPSIMIKDRKVDITFEWPKKDIEYSYKIKKDPIKEQKTVITVWSTVIDTWREAQSIEGPIFTNR